MRWLLLLLCVLISCAKPVDLKKESIRYDDYIAALPDLRPVDKAAPVTLNVHFVEADNLPSLTPGERKDLYRNLGMLTREVYGYVLTVTELKVSKLPDFFDAARERFRKFPIAYPAHAYLISYFAPDRNARIGEAIGEVLKKHDKAKVREYLGELKDGAAGVGGFLDKLTRIYAEKDLKGTAILTNTNAASEIYYSYGHWSSLLQGEKEADFILTNTGILGADTGMPLYVIARGGVTSAFIENNAFSPKQGVGVLGLYPFLTDTPYFLEKRGRLTRAEKIGAITWLWLHELGHLLLKKDENYTLDDSVHRAPPDLRYYEWTKKVRENKKHNTADLPDMKKF